MARSAETQHAIVRVSGFTAATPTQQHELVFTLISASQQENQFSGNARRQPPVATGTFGRCTANYRGVRSEANA